MSIATSTQKHPNDIFAEFLEAMMQGNIAGINEIVTKQNVLQSDLSGNTFLHFAAEYGTVEIVNQLLILGSNADIENESGKTPICYAIKHSFEMVQTLLTEETIVTFPLIQYALFNATEDIVRLLLIHFMKHTSPDVIYARIESRNEESNLLDELQNTEALIKVVLHDRELSFSKEEMYPLLILFASKIGNTSILQLILNDYQEYLASNAISTEKGTRFTQGLNVHGESGETALHFAVSQQHVDAVRFLLDQGADPNCKSNGEWTPLHYAALLENHEICQLLLNSGANVDPNEYDKLNPLHLVCGYTFQNINLTNFHQFTIDVFYHFKNHEIFNNKIMKLLLMNGAKTEGQSLFVVPLLLQACQANYLEEVKTLLEFDADVGIVDYIGNTALHFSAESNSIQIFEFLLKQGLKIDVKNDEGNTPLMFAIRNNTEIKPSMIEYLVDRGSSLSIRNDNNESVLDVAVHYSNFNIVLTLLELGADRTLKRHSDPENQSFPPKYCPFISKIEQLFEDDSLQAIISYIMLKEDNVDDYYICCFEPPGTRGMGFGLNYDELEIVIESLKCVVLQETEFELETLRLQKIFKEGTEMGYSYFDFLVRDFSTAIKIIQNPTMRLELSNLSKKIYPRTYCLLEYRFNLAVDLENCFDDIVNFFLNYGKVRLVIDDIEKILSYLSRRDIQVFGEILNEEKY